MSVEFTFETGSASHKGKVRAMNEDRFLVSPELGLFAVADGMGGHANGQLASTTLVEALGSIGKAISPADLLARVEDRVIRANRALRQLASERQVDVIGTTIAAILVHGRYYACLWSGDSRIYLFRAGSLDQLTRDHTEAQDLIDRGLLEQEEARAWPRRNVITRAIGVGDNAELDLKHSLLVPGDRFLICSDGLTNHVADEEIGEILANARPQLACDALVGMTLDRGASDNVTVVVVECQPLDGEQD